MFCLKGRLNDVSPALVQLCFGKICTSDEQSRYAISSAYVILLKKIDMEGCMALRPITENTLFYGDNLFILREHIASESLDLIYLDPPFNSSRNYNVLFRDERGTESEAQIEAFEDTWHWTDEAEHNY